MNVGGTIALKRIFDTHNDFNVGPLIELGDRPLVEFHLDTPSVLTSGGRRMVLLVNAMRSRDFPTTNEVSDEVGCKYRTVYERLNRLEDDGQIASRKVGSSFVWAIAESGGA